uniref:Mitochondrial nucleoid factor 1 n=1 Tax=Crocodylus porosus TaxID=8502 RepID=A0A7M4G0B8_CROPO
MAATRYRRFLKLCEEWPVDESKWGRDLGSYLRSRVAQGFREGENTKVAKPEDCDQGYESLVRVHTNYHKNKYPRLRDTNFTGLTMEECRIVIATGIVVVALPCSGCKCISLCRVLFVAFLQASLKCAA